MPKAVLQGIAQAVLAVGMTVLLLWLVSLRLVSLGPVRSAMPLAVAAVATASVRSRLRPDRAATDYHQR